MSERYLLPPTAEDLERLAGATVILSVSGGKDSAVTSLWLTEHGIAHERVHMLTGWDHELTLEYLRGDLTKAIGPITEIRGDLLMADLIRKKGMFPSRIRRFCTTELKVKPIQRYLRQRADETQTEVVNPVGIRAGESQARAKLTRWERSDDFDCDVWRPLIDWTEAEVIEMHRRHGLRPNPLYLKGATRVGCWPCIFSRKEEIRLVAEVSPERVDEIRALEAEVTEIAAARYAKKGETFESLGYCRPTMFHDKGRRMTPIPIDEVVAWSKTAYGGKQLLLLETEPAGCMRWGLCDSDDTPPRTYVPLSREAKEALALSR